MLRDDRRLVAVFRRRTGLLVLGGCLRRRRHHAPAEVASSRGALAFELAGARKHEDVRLAEAAHEDLLLREHDVADVAIEADAPELAACERDRDEHAFGARDVERVELGVVCDAARRDADATLGDRPGREIDRRHVAGAPERDVGAALRVDRHAARLGAVCELDRVLQRARRDVDDVDAIAIGVGRDDGVAVVADRESAARDRRR